MYGKHHSEESKLLMSKNLREFNKLHPKPKKVIKVMSNEELSELRSRCVKASWKDENKREQRLKTMRQSSKKRRLFSDDTVYTLRQEYLKYRSFVKVTELHPDITYNQVRNLIKFGTTHNSPNNCDLNWLNSIDL